MERHDVQLICLGSGGKELEDGLRWLEGTYRNRARAWVGFNEPFSHRLTAAADILLMPVRAIRRTEGGGNMRHQMDG